VWGQYDVVVVGGGTAGWRAAHAAAVGGARTLVVEFQYGTGGVGTLGATGRDIIGKMYEQRSKLRAAKVDLWFGAAGCGAVVENNRVRSVVVATPAGRAVVLAKVVIDATGNADIAAAAGAECLYTDAGEFGLQGTSMPTFGQPKGYSSASEITFTDETDLVDVWHLRVYTASYYPQVHGGTDYAGDQKL
jgi:hypothetical protein